MVMVVVASLKRDGAKITDICILHTYSKVFVKIKVKFLRKI